MTLLGDSEIESLLRAKEPLIDGFDKAILCSERNPVKGSSIDLTIGDIFVPGVKKRKSLGGIENPRSQISLECGQTVVLRSAEKLRMPPNIAGIGFPPSTKVSLAGLLSTNPGHVDPDYKGHLHLTVVNMGRTEFHLSRGDRLMRLMLFRLQSDTRHRLDESASPLTEELLDRLSHDFLDIDDRAKKAAKTEELRLRSWQLWATFAAALLTGGVAIGYQVLSGQREMSMQISKIEGRLNSLGGTLDVVKFEDHLKKLGDVDERLKKIELSPRTPSQPSPR